METTQPDELAEQMAAYERASRYRTQRLLKESGLERTELVSDEGGKLYIRKYLDIDPEHGHPYERLVGVNVPFVPHIVSASRIADKLVVVCEYIPGVSLEQLVEEQGPVSEELARVFVSCLADALTFLHTFGDEPVIHRDVNPSNIIVNAQGAWLIDLGIARVRAEGAHRDTHLWGTAGYAAPEQFGFGQTDARSDVYALGKVLLFMLAGHADAQPGELSSAHARRVVETAIALDPRQRYRSVQLLKADYVDAHRLNTSAKDGARGSLGASTPLLVWRIVGTSFLAVLSLGYILSSADDPSPANIIVSAVIWVFFCLVPWFVTTNMFSILDKIPWFGARRWLIALVIVAASFTALLAFSGIWMSAGLPWPSGTTGA